MKKTLRIELDYNWVLTRIDDAKYPVEVLKDRFVKGKIEKINESYLHLTLAVDENDYEKQKQNFDVLCAKIRKDKSFGIEFFRLRAKYGR